MKNVAELFVGSPAMVGVREQAALVASMEIPVMIVGEPGSGSEIVAALVHRSSARASGAFVEMDSAGVSPEEQEKRLFGSVGGRDDKAGLVERADGGTLFIRNSERLARPVQSGLVKVIDDGTFRPVGSGEERRAEPRLVFGCSSPLPMESEKGRFVGEFYGRIRTFPIVIPPLRQRPSDIDLLAVELLERRCREEGKSFLGLSAEARDCLRLYSWPGNERELEERLKAAVRSFEGGVLRIKDLPVEVRGASGRGIGSYAQARLEFERKYITKLLVRHGGNISRMAGEAGKHRMEIYRMLKRVGIDWESFRKD